MKQSVNEITSTLEEYAEVSTQIKTLEERKSALRAKVDSFSLEDGTYDTENYTVKLNTSNTVVFDFERVRKYLGRKFMDVVVISNEKLKKVIPEAQLDNFVAEYKPMKKLTVKSK